jgi:ribose-phosphate pyrophosphokinase
MLFFLGALRDASAARITAVMPYLCYARKDRRTKPRDPVTTRYVAELFEAMGIDRVVVLDVHNPAAFHNAWRIPAEHLEAKNLFVGHFAPIAAERDIVVVSPDAGGVKRVEEFRLALAARLGREVHNAFIEKYRSAGVVSGHAVVGDVAGKTAIILDDLISSGTTMARAAEACIARGADSVYAGATHGVFSSKANEALSNPAIAGIAITNSVPLSSPGLDRIQNKLSVLDVSGLVAAAIERIHSGGSIVELLESE